MDNTCLNCTFFPWKPNFDLSYLPPAKCHPNLVAQRWTNEGAQHETTCAYHPGVAAGALAAKLQDGEDEATPADQNEHQGAAGAAADEITQPPPAEAPKAEAPEAPAQAKKAPGKKR
jgi:hypothetical protein